MDVLGVSFVLVGVIGEIWVRRIKFPAFKFKRTEEDESAPLIAQRESEKAAWEACMSRWEHRWENVLVIGLCLELVALPHHFIEAGKANERAAKAELELARIKAPRTITKEQRDRFILAAKNVPKGPVKIGTRNPDVETSDYADEVLELIRDAGFTIESAMNYPTQLYGRAKDNSTVLLVYDSKTTVPPHGLGLVQCFNESGISVALVFNDVMKDKYRISANEVMVFVIEKRFPMPTP